MTGHSVTMQDVTVFVREGGPQLASEQDALDLMSESFDGQPEWLAVPVDQFAPEFFTLRTRLAGLFIQKLMNYGQKLAIVGDLSKRVAQSAALGAFITESNRGHRVWFVADLADLERRLAEGGASR